MTAYQIFISYAHEDETHKNALTQQLKGLQRQGLIAPWNDQCIDGGASWRGEIAGAIDACDLALLLVSPAFIASDFIYAEELARLLARREQDRIRVVPIIVKPCLWKLEKPIESLQARPKDAKAIVTFSEENGARAQAWTDIVEEIAHWAKAHTEPERAENATSGRAFERQHAAPGAAGPQIPATSATSGEFSPAQRAAFLDRLQAEVIEPQSCYTPLAGDTRHAARHHAVPPRLVRMKPEFALLRAMRSGPDDASPAVQHLDDASEAFRQVTQAVVLGEPGEGKTTTLCKIAGELIEEARSDMMAALPVLARLRDWTTADEPLLAFLARCVGIEEAVFSTMLARRAAVLLLDGLNELPVEQRKDKAKQIRTLLQTHPELRVLISCRHLDYREDLPLELDTLTIHPLDPERILAFLVAHLTQDVGPETAEPGERERLGRERADDLFWKLAGGAALKDVFEAWQRGGADLGLFFSADDVPRESPDVFSQTSDAQDDLWRATVRDPRNLMHVAANPFMLAMLVAVYELHKGDLPGNRAALFKNFVTVLLAREKLAVPAQDTGETSLTVEGQTLLHGLQQLAWAMQTSAGAPGTDARLAISRSEAQGILAAERLNRVLI